jgi:acyl dehydratase
VATGKATLVIRTASSAEAAGAGKEKARPSPKSPGTATLRLEKHVTQEQINAYAEVSGDHNPIHIDPTTARAVGLDGTIAHGMLSMAFVGEMLTDWLSQPPQSPGWVSRLRVRFQAMVRPHDTLICSGQPGELHEHRQTLEVWIENQHGDRIVTGEAEVAFSPD